MIPETPSNLWLFSDRCVLGGVAEPRREAAACLEIRGSMLGAIHETDRTAFAARAAAHPGQYLDLGDRLVVPSFVNGHTHLAMAAFRGLSGEQLLRGNIIEDLFFQVESHLTAEDVRAFARIGAYESLLAGVGTVFDHYYFGEAIAEALADVGLTGVVAPTLQDLSGPGAAHWERELRATEAIHSATRWSAAGIQAALGPHATDTVSERLWQQATDWAQHNELPIHAHVAQSFEEFSRASDRYGTTPLAWLERIGVLGAPVRQLLVHVIYATNADLERLDAARHVLGWCPYSQVEFCFPAPAPTWSTKGLPWLVATDCAASNDSMNVQKELRFASGFHAASVTFSEAARVFAATNGAGAGAELDRARRRSLDETRDLREPHRLLDRVWRIPGTWHPRLPCGGLEPGRLANLLVLDPDHPCLWPSLDLWRTLAMADVAPAIDRMMVAGCFVGRAGSFHRSLWEEARAARREADERLRSLELRSGLR